MRATLPAFTDKVALPLTPLVAVAVIVYVPAMVGVHVVVDPVVGVQLALGVDDQVALNGLMSFPKASSAFAVNTALAPAVMVEVVVLTLISATGPGPTVISPDVPLIDGVAVSVAVTVCDPAVLKVTGNVPTPFVNVAFGGRTALASLDVIVTVPV